MLRRILLAAFLFTAAVGAAHADETFVAPDVQAALKEAQRQRVATLVEFRAPWCYSCYYMARHVHTGKEWEALKARARVVEMDADSPEGAAQMKAWKLKPLPAYVVLDAEGREVGRVLGEQTRQTFYAQMDAMLAPRARLDDLRATAAAGGKKGARAAEAALSAFHARGEATEAMRWYYDLPGPVRRGYGPDPVLDNRLARLGLMQAAQTQDAKTCTAAAPRVFTETLGCETPYELGRYESCIGPGAPDAVMREQRVAMEKLADQRVLVATPTCADERSIVLGLAGLHQKLGEPDARTRLLDRAIKNLQARLDGDLGRDRSAADNLRVYLEQRARWDDYDALMPKLIATWPEDYVYAFRFGRSLVDRDRASEALPYLSRAAARAYGENRLRVAEQRVKALRRLGQQDEARKVGAEALKANGPWFPELAEALKSQL